MGQGYTRNDTSNNIASGNVASAADLDGEFDAIVDAFHASTGHTHDGTSAEGAPITVTGPAQEYVSDGTSLYPKTDGTYDLGSVTYEWKDIYIDGVAYLDQADIGVLNVTGATTFSGATIADLGTVTTADINGGTVDGVVIGGSSAAAATFTDVTASGTIDLSGSTVSDGGAVTTVDINGGTIDGVTIGGSSAGAGTFSTLTSSGTVNLTGATVSNGGTVATVDINGGTIDGASVGATSQSTGSFTDLTASGTLTLGATALTATFAELNKMDGVTATTAEINYVDGVTSNIQTQIDGKQASDAGLTSIAGLTTAADKMVYTTASDTYATADLTSFARTLLDDANASAARTTLGVAIGSDVQAYDATLGALAGLSTGSNKVPYSTGTDTFSQLDFVTSVVDNDTQIPSSGAVVDYVAAESGRKLLATIDTSSGSTVSATSLDFSPYTFLEFVVDGVGLSAQGYLGMKFGSGTVLQVTGDLVASNDEFYGSISVHLSTGVFSSNTIRSGDASTPTSGSGSSTSYAGSFGDVSSETAITFDPESTYTFDAGQILVYGVI